MVYKLSVDTTKGYNILLAIKCALLQWFVNLIWNDLMQIGIAYSTIDLQPTMMKYFGGHVEVFNPLVKLT